MGNKPPRRFPVVLYAAAGEPEPLADYCRQYAHARDWDAIETATDTDRSAPLTSRPGWTRVLELLAAGTVRGVVTYSAQMIAESTTDFDAVRDELQDRDAFLSVARSITSTPHPPTRHTAAQATRRRDVADIAAGYDGCGTERESAATASPSAGIGDLVHDHVADRKGVVTDLAVGGQPVLRPLFGSGSTWIPEDLEEIKVEARRGAWRLP
ncbi:recombinase family protein [Streptomyces lunalinharesii]|uniref:Resolvase/invertase-type recombinase catalytic domain-containing protein n=1 Tax=Streptomyces lunalinharesii TaxID=333384 RepID=A0ABP6F997_9ACTN